jgi:hypothetical protein
MAPEVEGTFEVTRMQRRAALGSLAIAVLAAGCWLATGAARTENVVVEAGVVGTTVGWPTTHGVTTVQARAGAPSSTPGTPDQTVDSTVASTVASTVGQHRLGHPDALVVTLPRRGPQAFAHDRLDSHLGALSHALGHGTHHNGEGADGTVLLVVGAVVLVTVAVVLYFSLARLRRQRRKAAAARTALIMATLPPELWTAAGAEVPVAGPTPPPLVPLLPEERTAQVAPPLTGLGSPGASVAPPVPPPVAAWPSTPPRTGEADRRA